jgi:hypothetical protein
MSKELVSVCVYDRSELRPDTQPNGVEQIDGDIIYE